MSDFICLFARAPERIRWKARKARHGAKNAPLFSPPRTCQESTAVAVPDNSNPIANLVVPERRCDDANFRPFGAATLLHLEELDLLSDFPYSITNSPPSARTVVSHRIVQLSDVETTTEGTWRERDGSISDVLVLLVEGIRDARKY